MKKYIQLCCVLLVSLLPIACASLPMPTQENVNKALIKWPGTTLMDLRLGRKNYVENCAACHNLYLPSEFSESDWKRILVKMQKKAKINDEKTEAIREYILSVPTKSESVSD